ncbi:MAG: ABC transporter ATP-binding protein [Desulfovibrio sp.]|nr:ABC transporter ATP-binding protein [Desulfovibrio sp.]
MLKAIGRVVLCKTVENSTSDSIQTGPVLQAVDVSLCYPGSREYVFNNVNLEIREQEVVALLGESGCGKTSLLNIVGGLFSPTSGSVAFYGKKIHSTPAKIAIVFQDACLLPWLTVAANVAFALRLKSLRVPADERKQRVQVALREVGLEDAADKYPAQLSGGMAQRTALARTLARQAELILLDEPFSSLDAITRKSMQELLLGIIHTHKSSALIVTHDIDEALIIADRLLLMTKEAGGANIADWDLGKILGNTREGEFGEAKRHRRSTAFMDLREEISSRLAQGARGAALTNSCGL